MLEIKLKKNLSAINLIQVLLNDIEYRVERTYQGKFLVPTTYHCSEGLQSPFSKILFCYC